MAMSFPTSSTARAAGAPMFRRQFAKQQSVNVKIIQAKLTRGKGGKPEFKSLSLE